MMEHLDSNEEQDLVCTYADDICFLYSIDDQGKITKHGQFKADFMIPKNAHEESSLTICKFNPTGTVIATGGEDSNVRLWNFNIGSPNQPESFSVTV